LVYLKDGFFLSGSEDGEPKEIKVQILTYNGITETFGYVKVDGSFKNNGRIEIKPTISIFGVNMYYPTPDNENRFAFELLFILFLTIDFLLELKQMISATVGSMRKKNKFCCSALLAYWTGDMWNILDSTTIGLLFAQVVQWSYFVTGKNMTVVFFHCAYLCPYLMCTLRPLITDALMHHCTTALLQLSSLFSILCLLPAIIPKFAPESSRWVYESLFTNARYLQLHQSVRQSSNSNASNSSTAMLSEAELLLTQTTAGTIQLPTPFNITGLVNNTNVTCLPIKSLVSGGYQYEQSFKLGWSEELSKIVQDFDDAEHIVNIRSTLDNMIIVIILFQVLRLLKVLDFQPKLALVTKTVLNAGWELFHFVIVFGMQTVAFSACAHVAFGTIHPNFSTYGESISSCFNLFLGDTSAHAELSKSDRALGWYLFFLTYMSLVRNILLAILDNSFY